MNFQAICRVCARESSGMLSIFESYNFPAHNYEIFKAITDCASIQIQKFDGFSEQICRRCLDHLTQAYSFKTLCEDSDYKFRTDLIVSDKINIKNEFPNAEFTCCETDAIENIATNASVIDNRLANGNTEEIKTENKSNEDEFRIQELEAARLSTTVTERMGYEGPSSLKPPQYIEEAVNGSPYQCELCSICRIHREQFSEESNNQFRNKYHMTQEFKSEFSSDDTVIRYGDGDYKNPDNITNVGLTQVEKVVTNNNMDKLQLNSEYSTFEEVENNIKELERSTHIELYKRDSKLLTSLTKKCPRKLANVNERLKYYRIVYACAKGGKKFVSRGQGKRTVSTCREGCPFQMCFTLTTDSQSLILSKIVNEHNHEIQKGVLECLPKQRRLVCEEK